MINQDGSRDAKGEIQTERAPKGTRPFKTVYGARKRVAIAFAEPSRTKQSFKDECDINNILKRYERTGQLPELIQQNPQYGDFSDAVDYQEALNIVRHAQTQFDALPAHARERFGNNPEKFLAFMETQGNAEEIEKLGLGKVRQNPEKKFEAQAPKVENPNPKPDPKDPK